MVAASRTAQETVNSFAPELHSTSTNPIWRAAHTIRQVSYVLLSAAWLLCRTTGIFIVQRKKCTNKTKRLTQPHIKYKAELGLRPDLYCSHYILIFHSRVEADRTLSNQNRNLLTHRATCSDTSKLISY